MARIRINWNSEKLLSISAMSISFITLIIFVYQTNLMRKQNYLSILPYLAISTSNSSVDHTFKVDLDNHGVGPAIIESVMMEYKDKKYNLVNYDNDFFKFLASLKPELDSIINMSYSTLEKGMAIPANTEYNILAVRGDPKDYEIMVSTLTHLLNDGLKYKIIYKSIQDEHWAIHNNLQGPEKLD